MTNRSKRNIIFILIAIALASSIYGYFLWNKPHKDIKNATGIKTSAINLYNTFRADSIKAKTTFLNRIVEVSGIVKSVSLNNDKKQIILLRTSMADASINCTVEESKLTVQTGDSISLKGMCVGYMGGDEEMGLPGDVYLIRCYKSI
ncbi:MAG: OB-fold protein [Ginsengibacter sp.]